MTIKVYGVKPIKMTADRLAASTKVQITGDLHAEKSSGIPATTPLFDLSSAPVTLGSGDSFPFPPFTDANVPAVTIDTTTTMKFGGKLLVSGLPFATAFTPDQNDLAGSFDFETPIEVAFVNGDQQITVTFSYIARQAF